MAHAHDHGHHPTKAYYVVYLLLMVLLVVTVALAYVHLGALNLTVAMIVATVKAALVVWYFMHLKDSAPMVVLTFCVGLFTLSVAFTLMLADYMSRPTVVPLSGLPPSTATAEPAPEH